MDYWDQYLLQPSNELYVMRKQYSEKLQLVIRDCFEEILEGIPLAIEYQQGWPSDTDLPQSLEQSRERDLRLGFTGPGIHRDDLELRSDGIRVGEVLSRGQSKRVCLVLLLAVLKLVSDSSHNPVILLIDDLHSELDQHAQQLIYRQLLQMDLQLFISNIEQVVPAAIEAKEFKMFHVEHGIIRPRIFS